jgi:hypothetical protein
VRQLRRPARTWRVLDGLTDMTWRCRSFEQAINR